jgi:hypothetical protein
MFNLNVAFRKMRGSTQYILFVIKPFELFVFSPALLHSTVVYSTHMCNLLRRRMGSLEHPVEEALSRPRHDEYVMMYPVGW